MSVPWTLIVESSRFSVAKMIGWRQEEGKPVVVRIRDAILVFNLGYFCNLFNVLAPIGAAKVCAKVEVGAPRAPKAPSTRKARNKNVSKIHEKK